MIVMIIIIITIIIIMIKCNIYPRSNSLNEDLNTPERFLGSFLCLPDVWNKRWIYDHFYSANM